ncbi:hypothetical protein OP492_23640 [Pseudomonas mosselii]|uniref:hypothetical protein n=1 Tax=Pseudomonas mosselii TaxID=78327 RepID=UPI0021A4EFCD|nr:hypothetical protein [Pseudomonas mosselii]MEA3237654.1 hypothetical protein [Pseudomonas mosselii]UWS68769.1 hypothetical protein N0U38_08285 [Pseudomonas mosselii]
MIVGEIVSSCGWLVIIDYKLYIIPEHYPEGYESSDKLEVSSPELIFVVVEKILPLGGGKSFIFHKADFSGIILSVSPARIELTDLVVHERGGRLVPICLDFENVSVYKSRYEEFASKGSVNNSDDWLDLL